MNQVSLSTRVLRMSTFAILLSCVASQASYAQLIAYEGFDYLEGDLAVVGTGALGGGTGWVPDQGWVVPPGQTSNPGASAVVANPANWGYTDTAGNELATSGQAFFLTDWDQIARSLDLSGVDASLLRETDFTGGFTGVDATDGFGAEGAVLWVSFLGRGDEIQKAADLQLGDGIAAGIGSKKKIGLGRPWVMQTDGSNGDDNVAWGTIDFGATPSDTKRATGDAYNETIFMVARIEFRGSEKIGFNQEPNAVPAENEIVTVWANPVLGNTQPLDVDAAIQNYEVSNFTLGNIAFGGNADTWFDEIRIGLDYASVAPIAAGLDGDFDGDLDVDGADFLEWQRNLDLGDATNLGLWESNYGTPTPAVGAVTAVPEPSSLLLAGAMAMLVLSRRTLFAAK